MVKSALKCTNHRSRSHHEQCATWMPENRDCCSRETQLYTANEARSIRMTIRTHTHDSTNEAAQPHLPSPKRNGEPPQQEGRTNSKNRGVGSGVGVLGGGWVGCRVVGGLPSLQILLLFFFLEWPTTTTREGRANPNPEKDGPKTQPQERMANHHTPRRQGQPQHRERNAPKDRVLVVVGLV